MSFVSESHLRLAISSLSNKHVIPVVLIPSMVKSGVHVVESEKELTPYGSADDIEMLNEFFAIPGGPADKKYFAVWQNDKKGKWIDERYPGRTLQRIRTDRAKDGSTFYQQKRSEGKDLWGIRQTAGDMLKRYVKDKVSIADLAVWYGRNKNVDSIQGLIDWFLDEFPLNQDYISSLYTYERKCEYESIALASDPLDAHDYASIIGSARPTLVYEGSIDDLCSAVENRFRREHFVLIPGIVRRVISAWLKGEMAVLVGQPGTGKTKFAEIMELALRENLEDMYSTWIPIRTNTEESDLIGYERLDGSAHLREFSEQVLLSDNPLGVHLVVLEEFNLATLEDYLGSILIACQDPLRRVYLPSGEETTLPVESFFLATCNAYIDEPETRQRVSSPAKRRAEIIYVPNILRVEFENKGPGIIIEQTINLIQQERQSIAQRNSSGLRPSFDALREDALKTILDENSLSPEVRKCLTNIGMLLLSEAQTRDMFTMGVLKSIALGIAFAEREASQELTALGDAVTDKILHQLKGPTSFTQKLMEAVNPLPNANDIRELIGKISSPLGDEYITIL